MTSRIVRVGKMRQLVTTVFESDETGQIVHEHITLSTPTPLTDTARLRLLTVDEMGRRWPQ